MGWHADTMYMKISIGTSFHIVESPTIWQGSPQELKSGDTFPIHHPDGTITSARVVQASADEVAIELSGGTKWRMTRHAPNDPPVSISSPGLRSQEWVIRSQLP